MKKENMFRRKGFWLSKDQKKWIEKEAKIRMISESQLVRIILCGYIEDIKFVK